MPGLSYFIDEDDLHVLIDRLNADTEIAFIVPDGPLGPENRGHRLLWRLGSDMGHRQRWRAVQTVDGLRDGRHSLWHVPAGPLPLLKPGREGPLVRPPDPPIPDPWAGWTEERSGAEPEAPYFGPGCHATISLQLWTRHRPYTQAERAALTAPISWWTEGHDFLAASDLGWTGSYFRPAPSQTRRWWNRMKAWVGRSRSAT